MKYYELSGICLSKPVAACRTMNGRSGLSIASLSRLQDVQTGDIGNRCAETWVTG